MEYRKLSETFKRLEETTSRNRMIELLAELYSQTTEEDISTITYFLAGSIAADYKDIKLGIGPEMAKSAIALATQKDESFIEEKMEIKGDLGDVAFDLETDQTIDYQDVLDLRKPITVRDIHKGLMQIANAEGEASQKTMKRTLAALIAYTESLGRRYLVRLSQGTMRLGLGDMTILDGLAAAFLGSKDERSPLEHAYNVCSDIGYVAEIVKKSGLEGIKRIRVAINRPIRPMLAQRTDQMSEIREKMDSEKIAAEEKYDGERIQVHKDGDDIRLFSRRLNDVTHSYPDIVEITKDQIKEESAIIDGEAVAYDFEKKEYYPFQKLMSRRRKYSVEEYSEKIPVKYMVFDILYLNGTPQLRKGYPKRRELLEKTIEQDERIEVAGRIVTPNLSEIDEYFQECIDRGLEGVVCKSCADDSYYRAGAREWTWIKWKPSYATELSDTLDLVVIGGYAGEGKRAGTYGSLLCAAYNHERDMFETVCKLGTGFTDEQLDELPDKLADVKSEKIPVRVDATDDIDPDIWFEPEYVLEVKGSEFTQSPVHTCNRSQLDGKGLSLRFPRFERWRAEKGPDQATTVSEIVQMYEHQ